MGTLAQVDVGYPGGKWSFSQGATKKLFLLPHVKTGQIRPFKDIPCEVFETTVERFNSGALDEIVVPIRNNNSRNVEGMLKLLTYVHGWVAGEQYYLVEQCCLVNEGVTLDRISNLWTMGPAYDQVKLFKEGRNLNYITKKDTALAAEDLKKANRRDACAIASPEAGLNYQLKNLGNVCDNRYNFTHFLHIIKKDKNKVDFFTPDLSQEKRCITKIILRGELFPDSGKSPLEVFTRNGVKVTNPFDAGKSTFEHTTTILDLRGHLKSASIRDCFKELTSMKYYDTDDDVFKPYDYEVMGCFLANPPPKPAETVYLTPMLEWW